MEAVNVNENSEFDSSTTGSTTAVESSENASANSSTNGSLVIKLFVAIGCLAALNALPGMGQTTGPVTGKYAIVIHGGAGGARSLINEKANKVREDAIEDALKAGQKILADGGTALDAVEQVIRRLEDDPNFNAGKGAVFNAAGGHELDASIMDGESKSCGAVAGVTTVKNPISLARKVMTETPHVLLASNGAEAFASAQGVELVENDYFSTPARRSRMKSMLENMMGPSKEDAPKNDAPKKDAEGKSLQGAGSGGGMATASPILRFRHLTPEQKRELMGTVGCVALDTHGNLAAGTSTGGMSRKKFGRVGDSPIVGAGTYADNETCAVSGTGIGEQYIRNAVAYDVAAQMKYRKVKLQEAVDDNLQNRLEKNDGGLIAVDKNGNIATGTNTAGMIRGIAHSDGRFEISW